MDRHTLLTTQATLLTFLGIGVLLSGRAYRWNKPDKSSHWFAAGYILAGIGLALQGFRGSISPLLSIVLGNFLFLLLMPCLNRAIGAVTRQDTRRTFYAMVAINVCTVASYAYFTFVQPSVLVRSVEASIVLMVMTGFNASALLRSKDQVIAPAIRVLTVLMAVHFASSALRIAVLLRHRAEWFSIFGLITIVGVAITFLWVDALRLRDELEQRAMLDPLTSLFNRRALNLMATRELNRTSRLRQPCSALMIDIDRFKDINDAMGHAAGDRTLCAVAAALRGSLRGSDMATRLGGDEFFVLLPDADEETAGVVSERIRSAIDDLGLKTPGGQTYNVSVSIGQITDRNPTTTIEELLHGSDIMLYREKQIRRSHGASLPVALYAEAGGAHVQPSSA